MELGADGVGCRCCWLQMLLVGGVYGHWCWLQMLLVADGVG